MLMSPDIVPPVLARPLFESNAFASINVSAAAESMKSVPNAGIE